MYYPNFIYPDYNLLQNGAFMTTEEFTTNQRVLFKDGENKEQLGKIMQKQGDGYFVRTETAIYLVPLLSITPIEIISQEN